MERGRTHAMKGSLTCRCTGPTSAGLFDRKDLAQEVEAIERSHGSLSFLCGLHSDKPKATNFFRVGIAHQLGLLNLERAQGQPVSKFKAEMETDSTMLNKQLV